jgi:hypothetical protein
MFAETRLGYERKDELTKLHGTNVKGETGFIEPTERSHVDQQLLGLKEAASDYRGGCQVRD